MAMRVANLHRSVGELRSPVMPVRTRRVFRSEIDICVGPDGFQIQAGLENLAVTASGRNAHYVKIWDSTASTSQQKRLLT